MYYARHSWESMEMNSDFFWNAGGKVSPTAPAGRNRPVYSEAGSADALASGDIVLQFGRRVGAFDAPPGENRLEFAELRLPLSTDPRKPGELWNTRYRLQRERQP